MVYLTFPQIDFYTHRRTELFKETKKEDLGAEETGQLSCKGWRKPADAVRKQSWRDLLSLSLDLTVLDPLF
jgi:hypothetical protein